MNERRKVVTAEPENSETPLESVSSWVTPTRLFFVRNHFQEPTIDINRWRLKIEGRVRNPGEWTWEQLSALPQRTVFATVECAGNGRSFLQTRAEGVQWGAGAIGHAEWTGVPVRTLLNQVGVEADAREVVFEGADSGTETGHPGIMHFARSLPLAKAMQPDTLLALRMNGEILEPSHGYPVRLFVPGWYGVASVKWLQRIEVAAKPFEGYFQTKKYVHLRQTPQGVKRLVVGPMGVKSEIIRPRPGEVLGLGTNLISGVAWAGEEMVEGVDVSTDAGHTWHEAELIGLRANFSWCLWECLMEFDEPGEHTLMARARSTGGHVQPFEHDPLRGGYMISFVRPRRVIVEIQRRRGARKTYADAETLLYDMNAFAEENVRYPLDVDLECADGAGI